MAMRWKWIGWSAAAVAAVAIILCGFAGVVLCETALHPPRRPVPSNRDARTVQVSARDGIESACMVCSGPTMPMAMLF